MDYYKKSIEIILENQAESGAYIASPNFQTYAFCWLRDGSYIAYAMDIVGEHESAKRFYCWVSSIIEDREYRIANLIENRKSGLELKNKEFLHTRFTLDGKENNEAWENFQLDGYGSWLWGIHEHLKLTGDLELMDLMQKAIKLTVTYLTTFWAYPNYDSWEEHPNSVDSYTLAAIYGGLAAVEGYEWMPADLRAAIAVTNASIQDILRNLASPDQYITKKLNVQAAWNGKDFVVNLVEPSVDANLVGVAVPNHVFPLTDPLITNTISKIEKDLQYPSGGVYRYLKDTFYGGGEWILLTAWLGWYYCEVNEIEKAEAILSWIEDQADDEGNFPEQVLEHTLAPAYTVEWENKWGMNATPLLWSHAMYLILEKKLKNHYEKN